MKSNKISFLLSFTNLYFADYLRKIDGLHNIQKLLNTKTNLEEEARSLSESTSMSFEEAADYISSKYLWKYSRGEKL